ncbi:MAG: glutamate-cysteine ligase family protein [Halanaerobiales bacterium]|nr:glutamate-cysteine ligase family protein [Halanaerobiales bacterium]
MKYKKQIETFIDYFREAETRSSRHKIGVEFEHFILDSNLNAISYYGKEGVETLLEELNDSKWSPVFEKEHLVGLENDDAVLTLEPGAQLEISIKPCETLMEIKDIYLEFLAQLKSVLNKRGQKAAVLGYQPQTSIEDIELLPKKRYDYMYDYFADQGKYAYNMMKGTASIHINIDYTDEEDYIKKMRTAYFISPLIYYLFDNTPYFEGREVRGTSIREKIWRNCDNERSAVIEGLFDKKFGYRDYAEYLLDTPPIISKSGGEFEYSRDKLLRELMDSTDQQTVEHYLSMVFPDVRSKKYIEIRAADGLPYPYNFGYAALLKGLFYDEKNLNSLYNRSLEYDQQQFLAFRNKIINNDENPARDELIEELILMADGVLAENKKYLEYVKEIFFQHQKAKYKTLNSSAESKNEALSWCVLN